MFLSRSPRGIRIRIEAPSRQSVRQLRLQYANIVTAILNDAQFSLDYSGFLRHCQGWNMILVAPGLQFLIKKKGFGEIRVFAFKKEGAVWAKYTKKFPCDTEASEVLSFAQTFLGSTQ